MKWLFVLLSVLIVFTAQSQTCIIVYVSNHGIVAGADRKYHQTVTGHETVYYGKKIFIGGNCAWALSGADYYDTIHSICSEVCSKNLALDPTIKFLRERMLQKTVRKAMHQLFQACNEQQKKRFKENMTEVVFFKQEGEAYKAYRITILMPGVFQSNEQLHFETDSIVSTKNTVGIFVLGHYESFPDNSHPETWTNPAATIRSLIKKQSLVTPADVSSQSDLMKVTDHKFIWLAQQ